MNGNSGVTVSQRIQNSLGLNGRENCLAAGPKLIDTPESTRDPRRTITSDGNGGALPTFPGAGSGRDARIRAALGSFLTGRREHKARQPSPQASL